MPFGQGDLLRVAQECAGQGGDALRIGGGEQQGLALRGAGLGDEDDVVVEAHVQHAIGLVQHQGIQRRQVEACALQVIHDAARGADHDVGAVLQAGDLRSHGAAAAQGQHLDVVGAARQTPDFLAHLVGQFARRTEHQRLHRKAARIEFGQQGQRECRSLAATGLGLGDQVVSGQGERQAGRLDRRHLPIAELLEIKQRCGGQRQGGERQGRLVCAGLCGCRVHADSLTEAESGRAVQERLASLAQWSVIS